MKKLITALGMFCLCIAIQAGAATSKEVTDQMLDNVRWLGHDVFLFSLDNKTVYTDPFELDGGHPAADIILITHSHRDHCSPGDVAKISTPETTIVTTPDCAGMLKGIKSREVLTIKPGESLTAQGMPVEAVRAYNTNKKFHPRENGWVGYIFTLGDIRYYIAGDTDRIPEMEGVKCDVAFVPVSGTYVMTAPEAVEAALDIKPKLAVPMHYGSIVGDATDAEAFASALEGKVEVRIMHRGQ